MISQDDDSEVEKGKEGIRRRPMLIKTKRGNYRQQPSDFDDYLDPSISVLSKASFVSHAILSDGTLEEFPLDEVIEKAHSEGSKFWIDVELPDESFNLSHLRQTLWDRLNLSRFSKLRLLDPSQLHTPQVLILQKSALLVLRVLPPGEAALEIRHAAAICLKGLLITVSHSSRIKKRSVGNAHSLSMGRLQFLARMDTLRSMEERELPGNSTTAALALWLHVHLERVQLACNRLRDRIVELSEMMDQDAKSVSLAEIVSHKDSLLRLGSIAEEQHEFLQKMADGDDVTAVIDFDTSLLKAYLKVLLATAGATERTALRLEKRVAHLRAAYDATQQDAINKRLALLTILSAIFLPLTLMAGIWGMNFTNMPELQRHNAYYFALGAMAAVALTLITVFWNLGWLR
jgi:Mg2+ and Co2+ transporter CorA